MSTNPAPTRYPNWLGTVTVLVLLLSLLSISTVTVWRATSTSPSIDAADRMIPKWRQVAATGQWRGPHDADVVIISFADYECPYCRTSERTLVALLRAHPNAVAVVHKHLPLHMHQFAYYAARLAECGAEQGRFARVHEYLFGAKSLDIAPLELAEAADLPEPQRFVACARETAPVGGVEEDLSDARDLQVVATPTIVVQGRLLGFSPDSASLFAIVDSLLQYGR